MRGKYLQKIRDSFPKLTVQLNAVIKYYDGSKTTTLNSTLIPCAHICQGPHLMHKTGNRQALPAAGAMLQKIVDWTTWWDFAKLLHQHLYSLDLMCPSTLIDVGAFNMHPSQATNLSMIRFSLSQVWVTHRRCTTYACAGAVGRVPTMCNVRILLKDRWSQLLRWSKHVVQAKSNICHDVLNFFWNKLCHAHCVIHFKHRAIQIY